MNNSVITVIGKDRVGIVYDVSKILAENQINILNISQQLMDDFFYHDYLGGYLEMPQISAGGFGFVCGREQKTRA
ncbi:ACT domain-containing protein [Neisseria meningitidis]|nr:ACT domain-containing protein [Neisseria meningitidis]